MVENISYWAPVLLLLHSSFFHTLRYHCFVCSPQPSLSSTPALILFSKSSTTSAPKTSYSCLSCRSIPIHSPPGTAAPHQTGLLISVSHWVSVSDLARMFLLHPQKTSQLPLQLFVRICPTQSSFPTSPNSFLNSLPHFPFPFCQHISSALSSSPADFSSRLTGHSRESIFPRGLRILSLLILDLTLDRTRTT